MSGSTAKSQYPEQSAILDIISALVNSSPPPFLYVHASHTARRTGAAISAMLEEASSSQPHMRYARLDGVACFSSRVLYDSVINKIAKHDPTWDDGGDNWGTERYNESLDAFLHGLRAVSEQVAKDQAIVSDSVRSILLLENAEHMKDSTPELLVPLARLAELTNLDITVIFVSEVPWDDIKPSLGAAPDPFHLATTPPSKADTLASLALLFPLSPPPDTELVPSVTYAPTLRSLHTQFSAALYSVISPFTQDLDEIAYIATARWPGFVQPLIDEHVRVQAEIQEERVAMMEAGEDVELEEDPENVWPEAPSEETRVRLLRHFTPTFTHALEQLYPRYQDAATWVSQAAAEDTSAPSNVTTDNAIRLVQSLSRIGKFLLLAAYLASTNPAKSDVRIFGRLNDGRGKMKKGGGTKKARLGSKSGVNKVPQRLLGPMPFPLDRLLAIMGVLLEEYDSEEHLHLGNLPGAETELELQRAGVYGAITQLASSRLLFRTSHSERLDGPPAYRCGVGYTSALALSKDLGIILGDLMWETS